MDLYISLYYKEISPPPPPPPCQESKGLGGGGGDASGGRIILSSPKARNCWACSKFELVRLQRFWVLGDFGALRSPISPSIDIYKTMYTHTSWPEVIWKGRALIS